MKWTLVTGSGKRLGAEICKTLAERKYNILIHYRESEREALEVVQYCQNLGSEAKAIQADFSGMTGVNHLLHEIQENDYQIENIINNIGNFSTLTILETPVEMWLDLFQTNLHAPFALIQGLKSNLKSNQGSVINIGTAGAMDMRGSRKSGAYMLTKKSLYMLTRSLAKELAKDKVRVNMVSPGVLENSVSMPDSPESLPLGRLGALEEVCRAVLFLLDKNNAYITGQNIEVAGGYLL